jgi:hypothetical protein
MKAGSDQAVPILEPPYLSAARLNDLDKANGRSPATLSRADTQGKGKRQVQVGILFFHMESISKKTRR